MNKTATKTSVKLQGTKIEHNALADTLVNRFNGFTAIDEQKGDKRYASICQELNEGQCTPKRVAISWLKPRVLSGGVNQKFALLVSQL